MQKMVNVILKIFYMNTRKNIAILNIKGVYFRCTLSGISKDEAVNRLNNSVLEDLEDFCVILDTGLVEYHNMMRGKLIDGKE